MPVILIPRKLQGINTFISSIQQDVVIMIDEYEKVYGNGSYYDEDDEDDAQGQADSSLLSLMDGTYKNGFRRFFILTTNKMWINENMLNRPGRIRYKQPFADLNIDQINEIIDDMLEDKETFRTAIIEFLKPLKLITVDILKAIISEVNIYKEIPEVCCHCLNVESKDETYDVIKVDDKGKEMDLLADFVPVNYITGFVNGVKKAAKNGRLSYGNVNIASISVDVENDTYKVYDVYDGDRDKNHYKIKFRKTRPVHYSLAL